MGTETSNSIKLGKSYSYNKVKLNNPLMGTETHHLRQSYHYY